MADEQGGRVGDVMGVTYRDVDSHEQVRLSPIRDDSQYENNEPDGTRRDEPRGRYFTGWEGRYKRDRSVTARGVRK
jgi:hypothetical protein